MHRILPRVAAGWHLGVGAALTAWPAAVTRAVCGSADLPSTAVIRLLGVRSLAQGAVLAAVPSRPVLRAGAAVDALHAASMVPVVVGTRYRCAATASLAIAATNAAVELVAARISA